MAESTGQERTERATAKRRQEARKRGQVAMSREIPSALILLTALGVFFFAGPGVFERCTELVGAMFRNLHALRLTTIADAAALAAELFRTIILLLLPIFLPLLVAGFVGNVAQIGFEAHAEALTPKFSKMNPISGIKRLVSLRSLVELVKSILKILFVGAIAYAVISGFLQDFPGLVRYDILSLWAFTHQAAFKIIFYVCLAMLALAALDTLYQRWQYEQSLKMTKQEVKDERKQSEGDPKVKARIRSLQRQTAYHRMMAEVPKADVVITNPTHLAIALKFTPDEMPAPRVVAKGAGTIAERIRETAREHDVPMVENKPLAQALFKMADLGDYVPVDLYRAVAEVLAYVYRLKGKLSL
ncbi:MAG: flagellar biosynthesis protein FlhB [Desulfobacterales bacterium]